MNIFPLTILFPLLSFVILTAISRKKYLEIISGIIGILGVGISALISIGLICNIYIHSYKYKYIDFILIQKFWVWFKIDDLYVPIIFRLDSLSLIMLLVITIIGFIIHVYAMWYMKGKEGYSRFFAYTNLFMFNMILLVLSDNLLLTYLGWEGVGICSYLLIGFYYYNPKNGMKALKAFIMTRFGDICLICALFIIYDQYKTLNLSELLQLDFKILPNNISTWISILILIGSIGKSAQIPLHTWLVGAMVGPTPVSALIHAATMVTSGVYLINRMHNFFLVTPYVLYAVGLIGAITLIVSSCSALFQANIKKILAYSTISQIGYMFLALGKENWIGSIFHLTTHACSKALLFLSAASLIRACSNEQNIFKMGGLYRIRPFIYICFLVGGLSLSGLPIITSGFYSKELILLHMFSENHDYFLLFLGLVGTFLTPLYMFRMIFVVFHGNTLIPPKMNYTVHQYIALIVLLLLSTVVGGQIQLFMFNININNYYDHNHLCLMLISEILIFLGIWLASLFWLSSKTIIHSYTLSERYSLNKAIRCLILLSHYGWGIDWLYKKIFVKPYLWIAKKLSTNPDFIMVGIVNFFMLFSWLGKYLICTENQKLNWYLVSINIGVMIMLLIIIMY